MPGALLIAHPVRRLPKWPFMQRLAELLADTHDDIALNAHFNADGPSVFEQACALGCEGIVSKRLGSHYRSGRVDHWLKNRGDPPSATYPANHSAANSGVGAVAEGTLRRRQI